MTTPPTTKTPPTPIRVLKQKYPTYESDFHQFRLSITLQCLDYRVKNAAKPKKGKERKNTFFAVPEILIKYYPYLIDLRSRDMAGVKGHLCDWFEKSKDLPEFHSYYYKPNMEGIFKKQRESINPLPDVEYQQELPFTNVMEDESPSMIVKDTITSGRGDTTGDFMIEFGSRHVFKAPIMNESHYFECVKVFNEMYRSYGSLYSGLK